MMQGGGMGGGFFGTGLLFMLLSQITLRAFFGHLRNSFQHCYRSVNKMRLNFENLFKHAVIKGTCLENLIV